MSLVVLGLVMEAGESLTAAVDCSAGPIVKLTMPPEWVGDQITFQTSSDGNGYNDMYMPNGQELIYTVIAGSGIVVPRLQTGFLKIRSGTSQRPVIQPEHRDFAVALDVPGAAPPTSGELRVRLLLGG